MTTPKKWTEVYAYGTKEGDEEAKFFKCLTRNKDYDYMSVSALMNITGISMQRIEEIINKYAVEINPPLLVAHETNEDLWGYWERCGYKNEKTCSLSQKDKLKRIQNKMSN